MTFESEAKPTSLGPPDRLAPALQLGSQTFYVLLGSIFTAVVGFPLQIYVSRTLGANGLGIYSLIEGGIAIFTGFLGFGIAQSLVRFIPFYLERREYGCIRDLIGRGSIVLLAVGAVGYLLVLGSLRWAGQLFPDVATYKAMIALMGALIPLGLISFFVQQGLRGFQDIRYMVLGSSVFQLSFKAGLTVAAFAVGLGLYGYGLATVVSTLFGILWMAWGLRGKLQGLPKAPAGSSVSDRMEWYRFATIFYATNVMGGSSTYLDRFMLAYFSDVRSVGIFMIARQLQQLPATFNQMLLIVGAPMFAAAHGRADAPERQRVFYLMTDWVVRASLPLIIFLTLFARPLLGLYGQDFADGGTEILLIMLGGQVINIGFGPIGNVVLMSGLERYTLRVSAASTLLSVALTIVLIPFFGTIGAAISVAVSWVFVNVCLMIVARRHLAFGWWDRRYFGWLIPSVAALTFDLVCLEFGYGSGAVQLIIVVTATYGVFFAANLLEGLHQDDKELLRHLAGEMLVNRGAKT